MPCARCNTDFNLLTWKIKCTDCEIHYCSKCLRKVHGGLFCEKCLVLNKRPPDRERLMELRAKDLREYLNKHNISTHGLVEKAELVELFYRYSIPVRHKRNGTSRLSSVFSTSVPNLAAQSQEHISSIRANLGANINNVRSYAENAFYNLGSRIGPQNEGQASGYMQQTTFTSSYPTQPNYSQPAGPPNTSGDGHQNSAQPQTQSQAEAPPPPKYPKLSDFETVEGLSELSVKQLKELLTLNRVEYKGCVEKTELLDLATRLWNDNNLRRNEDYDEAGIDNLCKICMDAPLDCVILECGHMATCVECGKRLAECPICRQYVTRVVRTFKV